MSEQLLQVRNLSVSVEDKPILHGIDLEVRPGETHVLMDPTVRANPHWVTPSWEVPVMR